MSGRGSVKLGNTRDEVQESLNNLRRNIANAKTDKERRQHAKLATLLLRRYGHLGVR